MTVTHLNFTLSCALPVLLEGLDEQWTNHLRSVDRASSESRVPEMCAALQGRLSGEKLFMQRSVPLHGFRPNYLPRKSARYSDLFACIRKKAVRSGHSWKSF